MGKAIGLIEFIGYLPAVCAADDALKAANVELIGIEKVTGGIVTVKLSGEVDAVQAAVEYAEISASKIEGFRGSHVIPRIDDEVSIILKMDKEIEVFEIKEEVKELDEIEEEQEEVIQIEEKQEEIAQIEEENIETVEEKIEFVSNKELQIEALKIMSVKELKLKVKELKVDIEPNKLRYLKKSELINMLFKYSKEGDD